MEQRHKRLAKLLVVGVANRQAVVVQLPQRFIFRVGHHLNCPAAVRLDAATVIVSIQHAPGWELSFCVVVILQGKALLPELVRTLASPCRFAGGLDGR